MRTTLVLLLVMCAIPHCTFSQTEYSKEQREVFNTITLIGNAWTENSIDTLQKYVDKDYLHTDVRGQVLNRDAWFKYIIDRKELNLKNPGLTFDDIDIRVYNDFAFVTGANTFTGPAFVNNDSKDKRKLRFTQVLRKEKKIWKRMVFQATYVTEAD